jgi:hypothetical protein
MLVKRLNKHKSYLIFLIPATLILSSCGATSPDIRSAQQLAQIQDRAKKIFPRIAGDVYSSCLRSAELTLLSPPTKIQPQIDKDRQAARKVCQGNPAAATKALNDANQTILGYLETLGKLATDDFSNFDKELDGISSSLQNLPGLETNEKKEAVDAGTAIAKFLFKSATEAYRRDRLKLAVTTVDAPLKILVTALDKAVRQHYINGVLDNEQIAIDAYYKYYLGRILTAPIRENVSTQVATETNKDNEWKSENNRIAEKKDLARDYLRLLQTISEEHHNLYKTYIKGGEPSPSQVKKTIDKYSKKLKSLTKKSEKLFSQT